LVATRLALKPPPLLNDDDDVVGGVQGFASFGDVEVEVEVDVDDSCLDIFGVLFFLFACCSEGNDSCCVCFVCNLFGICFLVISTLFASYACTIRRAL
jgi:hypothetical protein